MLKKERIITFAEAINEALVQSMKKDKNVLLIGLGVDDPGGVFGTTKDIHKKFKSKIVPVYIERLKNNSFKLKFDNPLQFSKDETIASITLRLNKILEEMIIKNPGQWIWTHNRWK